MVRRLRRRLAARIRKQKRHRIQALCLCSASPRMNLGDGLRTDIESSLATWNDGTARARARTAGSGHRKRHTVSVASYDPPTLPSVPPAARGRRAVVLTRKLATPLRAPSRTARDARHHRTRPFTPVASLLRFEHSLPSPIRRLARHSDPLRSATQQDSSSASAIIPACPIPCTSDRLPLQTRGRFARSRPGSGPFLCPRGVRLRRSPTPTRRRCSRQSRHGPPATRCSSPSERTRSPASCTWWW